jgi:outer membrane protein
MNRKVIAAVALSLAAVAAPTQAADWLLRVGAHNVNPKSDNHAVVNVDDGTMLTFNLTYLFTENWGLEVLAALPFSHDINLNAGGRVAETKHLPPTVSVQYHFLPNAKFRPYIGVGPTSPRFQ